MPYDITWDRNPGNRQPNFLQKLYDFMALDPHPCPEVIYWAADSRQLVIAQPDRLVKEVLPKLFKHDKLSSFGRQLNIYGFARVFPGRQFKDAQGNVLDASVWAHPTLHRLSTPSEIGSIKRRAAPKLFRTRRLANGQVVRSKAGPEVQRKFHEIKEGMADERRARGGWNPNSQSPEFTHHQHHHHHYAQFSSPLSPGSTTYHNSGSMSSWSTSPGEHSPLGSTDYFSQPSSQYSPSFLTNGANSEHGSPAGLEGSVPPTTGVQRLDMALHAITEGVVASNTTPFWEGSNPFDNHNHNQQMPMSPPNNTNHTPHFQYWNHPGGLDLHTAASDLRNYASCPPSIHTSPVLGPSHIGWAHMIQQQHPQTPGAGGHRGSFTSDGGMLSPGVPGHQQSFGSNITNHSGGNHSSIPPLRIAVPAAPNPFSLMSSPNQPWTPLSGPNSFQHSSNGDSLTTPGTPLTAPPINSSPWNPSAETMSMANASIIATAGGRLSIGGGTHSAPITPSGQYGNPSGTVTPHDLLSPGDNSGPSSNGGGYFANVTTPGTPQIPNWDAGHTINPKSITSMWSTPNHSRPPTPPRSEAAAGDVKTPWNGHRPSVEINATATSGQEQNQPQGLNEMSLSLPMDIDTEMAETKTEQHTPPPKPSPHQSQSGSETPSLGFGLGLGGLAFSALERNSKNDLRRQSDQSGLAAVSILSSQSQNSVSGGGAGHQGTQSYPPGSQRELKGLMLPPSN